MNKHAYLILAHKNPGQLKKLILLLDDTRNDIFVHIDASAPFHPHHLKNLCLHSGLYFTDHRITVHWGGVSIMRAELELLQKALSTGHYSYFHLLSGQDLPIKGQDTIHSFFDANQGKEFIHLWKITYKIQMRFYYYSIFPEGCGFFLTNILNKIFKNILKKLGILINKDIDFRYGSQWFSITENLARYVLSRRDWIEKTFRHTNTIDEVFIHTLVWNSEFRQMLYDQNEHEENDEISHASNMRLIVWERRAGKRHPLTLTDSHWDLLHSVPHFWARKFDEKKDDKIIDMIFKELKSLKF